MWVIHAGDEPVYENISGVGLFCFPSKEPVEIKDEHLAGVLLDRLSWAGLTPIPETRVKGLPQFDTKQALAAASEALKIARKTIVERYINTQLESRVRQNMPPLPPSPAVQRIIEEDGWDLASYGIHPVGWKIEERKGQQAVATDEKIVLLEKQNEEFQTRMQLLVEQNRTLQETNRLVLERMDLLTAKIDVDNKKKG
jgi:hypothetical protein